MSSENALKLFISYARKDASAFAEELTDALDVVGFSAFLDRNDIAAGEDWEQRLEGSLAAADTIVAVLTPGYLASERCGWEIRTAEGLNKRIIPVVLLPVPDAAVPPALGRLNYIFFDGRQSFPRALGQLATALKTDAGWIREHTRIAELADRWRQRGEPDVLLLRGPELEAARLWLASVGAGGQQPTDLQRGFIATSEQHEHEQAALEAERLAAVGIEQAAKEEALRRLSRRTTLGLIASGTLAVAAGGLAVWSVNAESRFREAQRIAQEAQRNSIDARIASEARRTDISGQVIAYATSATDVTLGAAQRADFTAAALRHLTDRDTPLIDAFTRAQEDMRGDRSAPRPLLSTSLNGQIYLGRPSSARRQEALVVASGSASSDADAWDAMLGERGFRVQRLVNPTAAQFGTGLRAFLGEDTAQSGSSGTAASRDTAPPLPNALYFLVFVGEAARIGGQTRLGFSDTASATLDATTVNVDTVAAALAARAAASVLVIDAAFTLGTGVSTLTREP